MPFHNTVAEEEMVVGIIHSMDMSLSKLRDTVKDKEARLQSMEPQRVRHNLETEQQPAEFYAASSLSSKFLIKNPLLFQFLFPAGNVLCQGASVVSNIWHLVPSRPDKLTVNHGNSDRFDWAPKSLQMVTATVKLKDACSLEQKL